MLMPLTCPSGIIMICIELPHSFSLFNVLDGFPIDFYFVPYVAILSRPLFILILSPILFRHFQKFSKLLHPLYLHLSSIHRFTIRLQPIELVMLLYSMSRWIPFVGLNKCHHFNIFHHPSFVLCHNIPFLIRLSYPLVPFSTIH